MASSKPYDVDANRGSVLFVSVWTMAAIAVLTLAGRFIARKMKGQRWLVDDWVALVALILALGCCICSTISVFFGIGRHLEAVGESFSPTPFWKLLFAYNQIYVMTGPVNKIAMLLMYRRIFDTPFIHRFIKWGIVLNVTWWLAMSISGIFTCIPVQAYWYTDTPGKKCFGLLPYDLGYAIVNISLDVFILLLPIREIWKLQLTRSQKVALSFVFLIGAFACVTALIRLLASILHVEDPDFTWVYLDALIWTAIEPLVAVICISLPTLRPVLHYILPTPLRSSSYLRSRPSDATHQQNPIVTIGSWRTKKRRKTDDLGFSTFHDDEGESRKALAVTASRRSSSNENRFENGIMVRQSFELSNLPANGEHRN